MEDGPYRAQRPTGGRRRAQEDSEDVLARHGLLGSDPHSAPPGGRAARRRAAEREALPLTDSGRHSVEPPAGRHGSPSEGAPRRRYRTDEPESRTQQRNGYAAPPEAGSWGSRSTPPTGGGGRRRAPEPLDVAPAPEATTAIPAAGSRRQRAAPDTAFPATGGTRRQRPPEPSAPPPAAGRRRIPDDPDEPAAPRRRRVHPAGEPQGPVESSGPRAARRRAADPPDEPVARRRPEAGEPPRRARPTDPPAPATTNGRGRRSPDPFDHPLDPEGPRGRGGRRHPAADIGRPSNGGARRYDPGPVDDPDARGTGRRPAERGAAATTAIPAAAARRRAEDPEARGPDAGGTARRRRPDPAGGPPPAGGAAATTAIPARRRGDGPDAPATTAVPTTRRRAPEPPDDAEPPEAGPARGARARPARPDNPATTVLPADGGRRARADPADPPATTALPTARGRAEAKNPEATVAVRSAPPGDDARRSDRDVDAHTRAMRIDETLTRLTAAHAGLTLAVTDRPAVEPSVPAPRRGPATVAVRLLAGAVALLVLAATAFGWGTKTWLGSAVRDAAALDPESSAVVDAAAQAGDDNVLVVATEPASDNAEPRADTVAVAHIPDGGGPVTVLAFPLDLEINRPPCETWDPGTATYREEPVQAEARTQLVSALDLGGPRCITRVVQQLSGLAITKYVGIDLAAVPAMTDAVGGAEICVPRPVLDGVLGPVVPDPGPNRLAGVRVADFVQAGDVEGEPSAEYGRIERQQQVLAAVLDSAVSGTALLDVGRLMALRPTLGDAVLTDGAGIDQVLALALTLRRLDADGVRYTAVPTGERNGRGNAVMRDTDAAALFAAVRTDAPLPEDATDPDAGTAGPTPSEVTVRVVNASTRSGLAGEVSETLSSLGFDVGEPESADQPTSETVIRFSPDQAAAAEVLRATVPSATEVPDPGSTGVLQLVLGQSFDDVVRAPSEPIALSAPTTESAAEPAVTCA